MILITLLFSLLRPHHSVVYAPKQKYADEKHAPPKIGKGLFAWFAPVNKTKEFQLVDKVGLDGTVFLRFMRMCRNIFLVLSVIGIAVLIPANTVKNDPSRIKKAPNRIFVAMTPEFMKSNAVWAHVFSAYALDAIVAFFLWRNYIAITRLRRQYFASADYVMSLHSRTLMITDIPTPSRTDEGILRILDGVEKPEGFHRTTIGRNVKDLPLLIEEHEKSVRELESVLAKYLQNPNHLPSVRPTLRPGKNYRQNHGSGKVDAIEYLTTRIRELESEIIYVRESIDKRNPMPYGFASYDTIEEAHAVAYAARRKHPRGTTITLAPRPTDLIWQNLSLSKRARAWKRFMNNMWITVLTVVWIAPNALIAVFLSNLSNLAQVWPAFRNNFNGHHLTWSAVQGIASPALLSLVYLILPIIFRRLSIRAGDTSKTSRERHVITRLYAFFVFNNLIIFSLFSVVWAFIAAVINREDHTSVWKAIKEGEIVSKIMYGLSNVSPFWLTWLLQRNLGAAVDLAQILSLAWVWFLRTFRHATPRRSIEWTAPPSFEYAVYYNYFLFYTTVAFTFITLQPLVLPITAFYFAIDYWLKKYLLLYVFVTKNESGGQHWRVIFNRLVFAVILSNLVVALVIKANGRWNQVFSIIPLLIFMVVFKWYCSRTFDNDNKYFTKTTLKDPEISVDVGKTSRRNDRVASRFGHPALYKQLMTPMVHQKAQHMLSQVYRGRLNADGAPASDNSNIALESMSRSQPGKMAHFAPTGQKDFFEVVPESQLDFAHFKDRDDFADEHGGNGAMYGRPIDLISERSGTPKSFIAGGGNSNSSSRVSSPGPAAAAFKGHERSDSNFLEQHPPYRDQGDLGASGFRGGAAGRPDGLYHMSNESERTLLTSAQPIGHDGTHEDEDPRHEQYGLERWRTGGSGYVGVSGAETPDERLDYDHYRGRR